jgi:CIC family chloride channel protein
METSPSLDPVPAWPRGYRIGFVSALAAVLGVLAGLVAYGLYDLIGLFTNLAFYQRFSFHFLSPSVERVRQLGLWVVLVPVVGGLLVGLMIRYGSEKISGHGIPEAMEAVLVGRSRIEPRVAILKPLSAALAIGTGGPFGAEGPIIQTGGAFGSLLGQLISTTVAERRVLLACGAGAGMAATFNTPIAGVILAIELLLLEFRSRSFIPLVISTVMATSVHFLLLGRQPMFQLQPIDYNVPAGLPWYAVLGLLCGLAATGLTRMLYWVEDRFRALPIPRLWHPVLGALGLGVIGYFVPRVFGVGYDTIDGLLNGQFGLKMLLILMVAKALALVVSLGSGTSGGLLAPMFLSSAAMGGSFALLVNRVVPGAHLPPGGFALCAMGAVFGAAARATFTFIVFAFEITRDYNAVLPLLLVAVLADLVAIRLLPHSIMTLKLARRGLEPELDYQADLLRNVRVREVMTRDVPTVPATWSLRELAERIGSEARLNEHRTLPVVDAAGRLVGVVTRGDLIRHLQASPEGQLTVGEICSRPALVTFPDERLFDALYRMLQNGVGRLIVVERRAPDRPVGVLTQGDVLKIWSRHFEEEYRREHGWLARLRPPRGLRREERLRRRPLPPADPEATGGSG